MTQFLYPSQLRLGQPGMAFKGKYDVFPVVDNNRKHQIDQGTVVSNLGDSFGVTFYNGVTVSIISTGVAVDDAILLAAAINATASLGKTIEKAVADDGLETFKVTYFDHEVHPLMVAYSPATADVTPIAIVQAASQGQNFPFGVGLVRDTSLGMDHNVKLPAGAFATELFAGVTLFENGAPNYSLPGVEAIPSGYPANLLRRGYIYVRINQDVTLADPVYLQHTVNGNNLPGYFRKDADGGNAQLVPGRWTVMGLGTAGMAGLELNLV